MKSEPLSENASLPSLLLVDDSPDILEQMKWGLKPSYVIFESDNREAAVEILQREKVSLVTLDLGLPPDAGGVAEGLTALEQFLVVNPLVKVVVITGNQDRVNALKAIQLGAYDFLEKPVDLEVLKVVLQRAGYLAGLERENQALLEREEKRGFPEIIGSSPVMAKVFDTIRRVAGSDISVLIVGESGTGKELVARAIHRQSHRKDGPFIAINCGAIPETLLESELFGHEKGAFTGALSRKIGRFELADGGTIFLDEIGELPLDVQSKLLRVLQEGQFERVGGTKTFQIHVRVIAATNRELAQEIRAMRFRPDLFYRLNVFPIALPPLRERQDDISLLAEYFVQKYASRMGKKIVSIPQAFHKALGTYSWPGNIRELEHVIERAVILTEGECLQSIAIYSQSGGEIGEDGTVLTLESCERRHIEQVLEQVAWKISGSGGAAELLGLKPTTLEARMKKLGIVRKK